MFCHVVMDTNISLIGVKNFSEQNQLLLAWTEHIPVIFKLCRNHVLLFITLTKSWSLPLRRVAEHRLQRLPEYCCCVFARLPVPASHLSSQTCSHEASHRSLTIINQKNVPNLRFKVLRPAVKSADNRWSSHLISSHCPFVSFLSVPVVKRPSDCRVFFFFFIFEPPGTSTSTSAAKQGEKWRCRPIMSKR